MTVPEPLPTTPRPAPFTFTVPDIRPQVQAMLAEPTDAHWVTASQLVIWPWPHLTWWHAVTAVDPTYPTRWTPGQAVPAAPSRDTLIAALGWALSPEPSPARHLIRAARLLDVEAGDDAGDDLIVAHRRWNTGHTQIRAAAHAGHAALAGALGRASWVQITSDGGTVTRIWCDCSHAGSLDGAVRYETWTTTGRQSHGFACPHCRKINQTG